jgi:Domain of unknown function (DUF4440)
MPGRGVDERTIVVAFNEAINRGDLEALTALMADDHRFVDAAGSVVAKRRAATRGQASPPPTPTIATSSTRSRRSMANVSSRSADRSARRPLWQGRRSGRRPSSTG